MRSLTIGVVAACLAVSFLCLPAQGGSFDWVDGLQSSRWWASELIEGSEPSMYRNNWGRTGDPPPFPTSADDVTISTGANDPVRLVWDASISTLAIGEGDRLVFGASLPTGTHFTIGGGSIDNAGELEFYSTSYGAYLLLDHTNTSLTGGGVLRHSNAHNNWIGGVDGDERLTNVNNTIRGAMALCDDTLALTNHCLIDADDSSAGSYLTIDPNDGGVINTGTMQASNGGELHLSEGTFNNTGGVIRALTGSVVRISTRARIVGGTLNSSGTGHVRCGGAQLTPHCPYLENVTNAGTLKLTTTTVLVGTMTNTGQIIVPSTSRLLMGGTVTLNGGGSVSLDAAVVAVDGSGTLINVNNTISGTGLLGFDVLEALTNTGTIAATDTDALEVNLLGTTGMTNDGTMRAEGTGGLYFVDNALTNAGAVEVLSGSELKVKYLGNGDYVQTGGTTWLDDGAMLKANVHIQDGMLSGSGTIEGDGNVSGGTVAPGLSAGQLTVVGSYIQSGDALLEIEIGGTVGGEKYDRLDVGGDLTPGGTLKVVLIDDFAPDIDDSFDILDWDTLADEEFDATELPKLGGRKAWDTSDLYTTGEISVIRMLDGDTDADWDVDPVDLTNLIAQFGGPPGEESADFNGDDFVDLEDFVKMRANFGVDLKANAPGYATTATPEPATLAMLALGGLALLRHRRGYGGQALLRRRKR